MASTAPLRMTWPARSTPDLRGCAEKAMKCVAKGYDATQIALTQSKDTPVRKVYQASAPGNNVHWMIVVSRPYWLSTLAEDPNRVAWVVLAAYQIGE